MEADVAALVATSLDNSSHPKRCLLGFDALGPISEVSCADLLRESDV